MAKKGPRPWPPPAPPAGMFYISIKIKVTQGQAPVLAQNAVQLVGQSGQAVTVNHYNPNFGSGLFGWWKHFVPYGKYKLKIQLPRIGNFEGFEVIADPSTGNLIRDLGWDGAPCPPEFTENIFVEFSFPSDIQCLCAIAVDCPSTNTTGITGGKLWVGDTLFTIGSGAGVPPALIDHYRGTVAAGSHQLRFEHPRYQLPADTPRLQANQSIIIKRISVTALAPPVTKLVITGPSFVTDVGKRISFSTNLPPGDESSVSWSSSDDDVLQFEPSSRQFVARAMGVADITATANFATTLHATAKVAVRTSADQDVLRPVDPSQIVNDPWVGGPMVGGEVLVQFKPGVSQSQQDNLLKELGLSQVGYIPSSRLHQLAFDSKQSSIKDVIRRLDSDTQIAFSAPNVLLTYSSIPPHYPSEVSPQTANDYWHFHKMEAYEAFALIKSEVTQRDHSIIIIDSGVWVDPSKNIHVDLAGTLDLTRSYQIGWSGYAANFAAGLDAITSSDDPPHGTLVAGAAAAAWGNGAAFGVDPTAKIVMIKHQLDEYFPTTSGQFVASLNQIATKLIDSKTRVVNMSFSSKFAADWVNKTCKDPFEKIIGNKGLIVISAGNNGQEVTNEGLPSIKAILKDNNAHQSVIVVTATELINWQNKTGSESQNAKQRGATNFAPPGAKHLVDIAAPGDSIWTSGANHARAYANGTSIAAPLVAGAAAMLFSMLPETTTANDVREILIDTSDFFNYTTPTPSPAPRLHAPTNRWIGLGRLNLWQAVLFALNKMAGAVTRYVGLRVTAQFPDFRVELTYKNKPPELLVDPSILTLPSSTDATRITLTNRGGTAFPLTIVGKRKDGSIAYEQKLLLTTKLIDELSPRFVKTIRMYTNGGISLKQNAGQLPPNEASFAIKNEGQMPNDEDLLDPISRSPKDKSLKPWMVLAKGDSYALIAEVKPPNPAVTVDFVDASHKPFGPDRRDDEGHAYVTIPFGQTQTVFVQAQFADHTKEADVEITVESLNNRIKRDLKKVTLRPALNSFRFKVLPGAPDAPNDWRFIGRLEVTNAGTSAAKLSVALKTDATWDRGYDWEGGGTNTFQPNEKRVLRVHFYPRSAVPAGTTGFCQIELREDGQPQTFTHSFPATVSDVDVLLTPPLSTAANVIKDPAGQFVYAEFPWQVTNRSKFPIRLLRDYADFGEGVHSIRLLNVAWDAADGLTVDPGKTLKLTAHPNISVLSAVPPGSSTPPRVIQPKFKVHVLDPNAVSYPPAYGFTGYKSSEVVCKITLKLL